MFICFQQSFLRNKQIIIKIKEKFVPSVSSTFKLTLCSQFWWRRLYFALFDCKSFFIWKKNNFFYLHPGLGQTDPHRDLLPEEHVRIMRLLEQRLQLLQLLRTERRPIPALPPPPEHVLSEKIARQRREIRPSHQLTKNQYLYYLKLATQNNFPVKKKLTTLLLWFLANFLLFTRGLHLDLRWMKMLLVLWGWVGDCFFF